MNWIEIIANLVEAILETQFFVRYFGCKECNKKRAIPYFFGGVVFGTACICNNIAFISEYEVFVVAVVLFVLTCTLLRGNLLEKLFIVQMNMIILLTSSMILTSVFDSVIAYNSEGYMETGYWRIVLLFLAKLVYFVVTELIIRNQIKEKEYVNNKIYIELNVVAFAMIFAYNSLLMFIYQNSLSEEIIRDARFVIFFLLIINIVVYILYINLTNSGINLLKEKMKAASYERRVNDVQAMKELSNQTRKINHDINKKLLNIKIMLSEGRIDDASRYLDEILEFSTTMKQVIVTDNSLIDAVINHHLEKCSEKNIVNSIKIECSINSNMEMDVAVMLANLLDNAIEATEKTLKKEVELQICIKNNYLCVEVSNTFDGNIRMDDNGLLTNKSDESMHGYGLSNVKDIVNKYDGIYNYETKDDKFCTQITLYLK